MPALARPKDCGIVRYACRLAAHCRKVLDGTALLCRRPRHDAGICMVTGAYIGVWQSLVERQLEIR